MLSFLHQILDTGGHDEDSDTDSSTADNEDEPTHVDTPLSPTFTDMDEQARCETLRRYGYRAIMQLADAKCQISKLQELCEEQQQLNAKLQVSCCSTLPCVNTRAALRRGGGG